MKSSELPRSEPEMPLAPGGTLQQPITALSKGADPLPASRAPLPLGPWPHGGRSQSPVGARGCSDPPGARRCTLPSPGKEPGQRGAAMELLVPSFQMTPPPSHLGPRARVSAALGRAGLTAPGAKAEVRPRPPSHPWLHTDCRTHRSNLCLASQGRHHANLPCAGALEWSSPPQGSPRRPGPQALDSFRHPSHLILQLRPIAVLSLPLLPAAWGCQPPRTWLGLAVPSSCQSGDPHPGLGSTPNKALCKHAAVLEPSHKRERGNPALSMMSQSRSNSTQRLGQPVGAFLLAKGLLPNS